MGRRDTSEGIPGYLQPAPAHDTHAGGRKAWIYPYDLGHGVDPVAGPLTRPAADQRISFNLSEASLASAECGNFRTSSSNNSREFTLSPSARKACPCLRRAAGTLFPLGYRSITFWYSRMAFS